MPSVLNSNVSFGKGRSVSPMAIGLVLVIILAVMLGKRFFDMFDGLLESLGLRDTKGDKEVADLFESGTPVGSPWNGDTWLQVPLDKIQKVWFPVYTGNVPGANPAGVRLCPFSKQNAMALADSIAATVSITGDRVDQMLGIYKGSIKTQAAFSYYIWNVAKYRGIDVLEWLQGEQWPYDRFSNEEIKKLNDYIRRLPKY